MSQDFSWVRNIFSNESLSPQFVIKAHLVIGIFFTAGPLMALILFPSQDLPIPREWLYVQMGLGVVLALGALLIKIAPSYYRQVVILHGLIFCAFPFIYTAVMWHLLSIFSAVQTSGSHIRRIAHAPGILAICMSYGIKLLSDPFMTQSRQLQKTFVRVGFAAGGALDLTLIYLMVTSFISMFNHGFHH